MTTAEKEKEKENGKNKVVILRRSLSINALRAYVYVRGHFRMIRKWRTSSIFVFCPFSRETNWHKLRKVY